MKHGNELSVATRSCVGASGRYATLSLRRAVHACLLYGLAVVLSWEVVSAYEDWESVTIINHSPFWLTYSFPTLGPYQMHSPVQIEPRISAEVARTLVVYNVGRTMFSTWGFGGLANESVGFTAGIGHPTDAELTIQSDWADGDKAMFAVNLWGMQTAPPSVAQVGPVPPDNSKVKAINGDWVPLAIDYPTQFRWDSYYDDPTKQPVSPAGPVGVWVYGVPPDADSQYVSSDLVPTTVQQWFWDGPTYNQFIYTANLPPGNVAPSNTPYSARDIGTTLSASTFADTALAALAGSVRDGAINVRIVGGGGGGGATVNVSVTSGPVNVALTSGPVNVAVTSAPVNVTVTGGLASVDFPVTATQQVIFVFSGFDSNSILALVSGLTNSAGDTVSRLGVVGSATNLAGVFTFFNPLLNAVNALSGSAPGPLTLGDVSFGTFGGNEVRFEIALPVGAYGLETFLHVLCGAGWWIWAAWELWRAFLNIAG